jgi:hypothetical protein
MTEFFLVHISVRLCTVVRGKGRNRKSVCVINSVKDWDYVITKNAPRNMPEM